MLVRPEVDETSEVIKMPGLGEYTEQARAARLAWYRDATGASLTALREPGVSAELVRGNIENFVGTIDVPVGLAGPLLFAGEHARGPIIAPMATVEGAVLASTARGARAMSDSGGVVTRVLRQRMTRVPGFGFDSIAEAAQFAEWVPRQREQLAARVREASRHAMLVEVEAVQIGRDVHVRFCYETGDATGQNMTSATTWNACQWILDHIDELPGVRIQWFIIEANMANDKKAAHLSTSGGRGYRVVAETSLTRDVILNVLKTTPETLNRTIGVFADAAWHSGALGSDVDAANVMAAMFIATGQDAASVFESGTAMISSRFEGDDLLITLTVPSLLVATVGGGTGLPQQQAFLQALGCAGAGKARRLAEIVTGFCLALDISTISAIAAGQFVAAHEQLGRKRP
ncbi:hydroxymethylglutaryl-CoA reductase [Nocardia alni]|uniref:hydroxymethylglutaryl-CoA reductase n=1 Tax=Nocardia alni TaxID=2815723 RepID=UPI001C249CCA|nr:hydroxymethylglutaryl-CoA reductase [Nocardia alni]